MLFKQTVFSAFILLMFLSQGMKAQRYYYNGVIGDTLKIGMTLSIEGVYVAGEYSYDNRDSSLTTVLVEGTLINTHLQLTEYSLKPEYLEYPATRRRTFEATLTSDSTVEGILINAQKTEHISFKLLKEKFDYLPDSVQIKKVHCDCDYGQNIWVTDKRIGTVVTNKLISSLNRYYSADTCPCWESEWGTDIRKVTILYNHNNILSVWILDVEGKYDKRWMEYKNYNLQTGEEISFNELFKEDFLLTIHNLVLKEIEKNRNAKETLKETAIRRYEFSLIEKKKELIVHVYDDYETAMYPIPLFEVSIPIYKIKPGIDPKGPLSFLLK